MNIKKGDTVIVTTGKDKNKEGKVIKTFRNNDKVLIDGVNIVKKHLKPSQVNPDGGIIEKEAPIHVSNVMIKDPKTGKPSKIGKKIVDGKKVRYAKASGEILE